MKAYTRSRTWLVLVTTVAIFSTINVYFLSPSNYSHSPDVEHGEGAIHSHAHHHNEIRLLDRHSDVGPIPSPVHAHDQIMPHRIQHDALRILKGGRLCPNLNITLPVEDLQSFQTIRGTKTFVYSAFLDKDKIRMIVLRKWTESRTFYCQIWTNATTTNNNNSNNNREGDNLFVTRGLVYSIPEDHGREFLASYIICNLPSQLMNRPPVAVSVVFGEKCSPPSNWVRVLPPKIQRFNFTVCVSPLNRNFSDIHMLVEMIEMNKLLGAERFVFYNYSIDSSTVGKILQHYIDRGEADLLQWPQHLPEKAHYFGQLASLNDCLYRYKNQSRFIVFQDLDEFIIPKGNHTNWSQLIDSRLKLNHRFSIFQARCTFFRKEWPKPYEKFPRNDEVKKYRSIVLGHTIREDQILHEGHRSKYIINPALVETVGIHDSWARSGSGDRMASDVALVYHYRNWNAPNDTQRTVEDTFVVKKYGFSLIDRLANAWALIHKHTGLTW